MKTLNVILVMIISFVSYGQTPKSASPANPSVISVDELKTNIRNLWGEHVTITHNVIVSIMTDQAGIDELVQQMVTNQKNLGNTIAAYYGDEAGQKFTKMLHTNISLAADVMIATRRGHEGAKAEKRLKDNSDEIAALLNSLNPNWKLDDMKAMIWNQQKYIAEESAAMKNNNSELMLEAYNKANVEVLAMADKMSEGIISQFPEKFQEFTHSYGVK